MNYYKKDIERVEIAISRYKEELKRKGITDGKKRFLHFKIEQMRLLKRELKIFEEQRNEILNIV